MEKLFSKWLAAPFRRQHDAGCADVSFPAAVDEETITGLFVVIPDFRFV